MKHATLCLVCASAFAAELHAQAVFTPADNLLSIPTLRVGADVFTFVVLRLDPDGRLTLVGAVPPAAAPPPSGGRSLQLNFQPQPNFQYWYDAQGQRQLAVCSNLPVGSITLKVPASATNQVKSPLVIALAGWAPNGNPPNPVPQDTDAVERLVNSGVAAATLDYRGCDNWSSPLVARTNADESFEISSSDFGLALAAIKTAVQQENLPVDTSRIVAIGTSFSSNLIFTLATQHRLQGAIAINGGCDYSCQMTGTTYQQPNDFRVNGNAIPVAATSGANDALFAPNGLGSSGYGAPAARARILAAIADQAKRPKAFFTHLDPNAGHERTVPMFDKVITWAQCMTNTRPAADCAADDR